MLRTATRVDRIGRLTTNLATLERDLDNHKRQRTAATIVFIVGLLLTPFVIGIPVIIFALFNYFRHKSTIRSLEDNRIAITAELARVQAGRLG